MKKIILFMLFSTLVLANSWSGFVFNYNTNLPVSNASVSLNNGINTTTTTSNGSGFFNVSFTNGTQCVLTFSAAGYYNDSNQPYDYSLTRFCPSSGNYNNISDVYFDPQYSNFTLTPLGTANLTITLLNNSGGLVNGTVYLNGQTQSSNQACNGTCAFTNLTEPVYNYTVTATGYFNTTGSVSMTFNSTSNLSINLTSIQSTLSNLTGAVFSGSTAISNAVINVYAYPSNTLVNSTTTNSNGLFSLQNINSGAYILTVTATGYNNWISQIPFIIPTSTTIVEQVSLTQQPSNPGGNGGNGNGGGSGGSYQMYGCSYYNPPCGSGMVCVNNACVQPQPPVANNTNSTVNQTQNNSTQPPVENSYIITQNYTVNLTSGNSTYLIPISRIIEVYASNNSFTTKITLSVFNNQNATLPDFYLREFIPSVLSNVTFYSTPSLMISSNEPEWLALSLNSNSFFKVVYTFNHYIPSSNVSLFTAPQVVAVQESPTQNTTTNNSMANVTNSTSNSSGLTGFVTAFKSPFVLGAVGILAVLIAVLAYFTLKPDESGEVKDSDENENLKSIVDEVSKDSKIKPKTRKSRK
jgi:hypothetical protein